MRKQGLSERQRGILGDYAFPYRTYWPDTLVTPRSYMARLSAVGTAGWKRGLESKGVSWGSRAEVEHEVSTAVQRGTLPEGTGRT